MIKGVSHFTCRPRFGAAGKQGSIAVIERLLGTLKEAPSASRADFQIWTAVPLGSIWLTGLLRA